MERRGLVSLFLTLISINFVSAQFYGSLSISDALRAVDPSTMVLGIIFVIAALLINVGLSRGGPLKYNQTAKGIISISLALLIIWGIDRAGFDYYGLFNGIVFFIPEGLLETIWPLLFFLSMLFVGWKFGWKSIFLALGIFLIGGAFFAYESGLLLILGGFFILTWLILLLKKKGPVGYSNYPYGQKALGAAKGLGKGAWGTAKGLGRGTRWFGKKSWTGAKTAPEYWKTKKRRKFAKWQAKEEAKETRRDESRRERQADIGLGKAKASRRDVNERFWRRKRGDQKINETYEKRRAEKEQGAQAKQAQREEQTQQQRAEEKAQAQQETAQKQQEAQEKQKTQQQKQLVMDFKALKKQIIDTQRQNPRDPRLEGWIKTLKQMRKQMKS